MRICCLTILTTAFVVSCGRRPPVRAPLEHRAGWLVSNCLAIDDSELHAGALLTVVAFGDVESIVEARIVRTADSADQCPALGDERRAANTAKGLSFYQVAATDARELGIGIGLTGSLSRVGAGIDVNGDGMPERFTQCATSEGISFSIWSGMPYQGNPLWSGYYYLGYDTERTCPA